MENTDFDPENIEMMLAQTLEFSINTPLKPKSAEPFTNRDIKETLFGFNLTETYSFSKNLIRNVLGVQIDALLPRKKKPQPVGKMVVDFIYQFEGLEKWYEEDEQENEPPLFIRATIAGLTFSTTRGILLARTSGTILEGCILPVVSPIALLKD